MRLFKHQFRVEQLLFWRSREAAVFVFLFPLLVLLSLFLDTHLTFLLPAVYVVALLLMAIAVWQVTQDGEAVAFEGLALVGFYVILAVLTFYE